MQRPIAVNRWASNRVRESYIGALADTVAVEHIEEAAFLMAMHRSAEFEAIRSECWEVALELVTRPLRRRRQRCRRRPDRDGGSGSGG